MGYTPPYLDVRKVSGGWTVYPTSGTTDDLTIYANGTDTYALIKLYGTGQVLLKGGAADILEIADASATRIQVSFVNPDVIIESPTADKNMYLKTAGTGVVKFGTYTAGAATDSTGYITILDAAGNTRKLMVQA